MGVPDNVIRTGVAFAGIAATVILLRHLRGDKKKGTVHVTDEFPVYTLSNKEGVEVHITTVGAAITKILLPTDNGDKIDVVLGYDRPSEYLTADPCFYFGTVVGRVANRIANATFSVHGKQYKLVANNGNNALHGGVKGLHKRVWTVTKRWTSKSVDAIEFEYQSPHLEEGYPGKLTVTASYQLSSLDSSLKCTMKAKTDFETPVNLAQHSYFNLAGHDQGTILNHTLFINAGHYTPVDENQLPTGEIRPVEGTPLDFLAPATIGERIAQVPGDAPGGYDHNYALIGWAGERDAKDAAVNGRASEEPRLAATLVDPESGRALDVLTTAPGLQFYSGNYLEGHPGKGGVPYHRHAGLCLETQAFPDAVNQPGFPGVLLTPDQEYRHDVVYRFYRTAPSA